MRRFEYPTHEAWLAARTARPLCGGSTAAMIQNFAPGDRWRVWSDVACGLRPETTEQMEAGSGLEAFILDRFEAKTGLALDRCPHTLFFSDEIEWAVASPDALILTPDEGAECKAVCGHAEREYDWGKPGEVTVASGADLMSLPFPPRFAVQMTWYMWVLRRPAWWLAVLFGSDWTVRLWRLERSAYLEDATVADAVEFWERHIVDGEPPEIDDSDDCADYYRAQVEDATKVRTEDAPPEVQVAAADYGLGHIGAAEGESLKRRSIATARKHGYDLRIVGRGDRQRAAIYRAEKAQEGEAA